jgi:uncharacterized membrane protein YphA (DoxX/SURF4 family)
MQHLMTIACVLSTGIWVAVGLYKLTHRQKMVDVIRAHNIPLPQVSFWLSVFVELGGASLMLFQQRIWVAALGWLVFLCVATPIFHGRVIRNGMIDYPQLVHVGKNFSIAGGLIALLIIDSTVPRFFGWNEAALRSSVSGMSELSAAALNLPPTTRE